MLSFDEDVIDPIERTWKSEICKRFPEYARFWEKWIGTRPGRGLLDLDSYELIFGGAQSPDDRESILRRYEKVRQSHYAIFFNLAHVHSSLERLCVSLTNQKESAAPTLSPQAVSDASFMIASSWRFLGDAFNMLDAFVTSVLRINVQMKPKESGLVWLKSNMDSVELVKHYEDVFENRIRGFRDLYTHHPPHPIAVDQEGNWLMAACPPENWDDLTWTEQVGRMKRGELVEVTALLHDSLDETESIFNSVWPMLSHEMQKRLEAMDVGTKELESSDVSTVSPSGYRTSGSFAVADALTGSTTHHIDEALSGAAINIVKIESDALGSD